MHKNTMVPTFALAVGAELFRLDAVVRRLDAADGRLRRAAFEKTTYATDALPRIARRIGAHR
jgi:hypothetical protein